MLRIADQWVWDFWLAERGAEKHIFYLKAPKAHSTPAARHHNATVGHAVSADLVTWQVRPDAIATGPSGDWDDLAIWTGSVVAVADRWAMLYTAISSAEDGRVQRIGLAWSDDLMRWTKDAANPVLTADARWYETAEFSHRGEEPWRDPWVFRDDDNEVYRALITARSTSPQAGHDGVIGYAESSDLRSWTVGPPVSATGEFAQLEVPQSIELDGRPALIFSSHAVDVSASRAARTGAAKSGIYVCPGESLAGPFDVQAARRLELDGLYSGRIVQTPEAVRLLAFRRHPADATPWAHDVEPGEQFIGEIEDPITLEVDASGCLTAPVIQDMRS